MWYRVCDVKMYEVREESTKLPSPTRPLLPSPVGSAPFVAGAVCCSVLQCVAVCCSVLQRVAMCCSVLQCVAVCCSMLQCDAVCRSVLQCVARWCRVHISAPLVAGVHLKVFWVAMVDVLQRVRARYSVLPCGAQCALAPSLWLVDIQSLLIRYGRCK